MLSVVFVFALFVLLFFSGVLLGYVLSWAFSALRLLWVCALPALPWACRLASRALVPVFGRWLLCAFVCVPGVRGVHGVVFGWFRLSPPPVGAVRVREREGGNLCSGGGYNDPLPNRESSESNGDRDQDLCSGGSY